MTTNINKMLKPGECMKHITVEMHPALLSSSYCSLVRREVTAAGARLDATDAVCDPALVLWSRDMPPDANYESHCNRALYIIAASEAAALVTSHQLSSTVLAAKMLAGTSLTLVIVQAKDYFKSSGRKTLNSKKMTEIDLEMALTDLLVTAECDAIVVNSPLEVAQLILQFTKAIAEAPYKKAKRDLDEYCEFYARGENKQCIAIGKDGAGRDRLWQQMLAVLPNSSLEISRAIAAIYRTPRELYDALQLPNSIQEIADIGVERSLAPGTRARRIGPEFARKLHALFTSDDGQEVLD